MFTEEELDTIELERDEPLVLKLVSELRRERANLLAAITGFQAETEKIREAASKLKPMAQEIASVAKRLMDALKERLAACYPCAGSGMLAADFDFEANYGGAPKPCGCAEARALVKELEGGP